MRSAVEPQPRLQFNFLRHAERSDASQSRVEVLRWRCRETPRVRSPAFRRRRIPPKGATTSKGIADFTARATRTRYFVSLLRMLRYQTGSWALPWSPLRQIGP